MVDSKIGPVVKVTEILNEISGELANLKTAGFLKINIKDRPPKINSTFNATFKILNLWGKAINLKQTKFPNNDFYSFILIQMQSDQSRVM